MRIKITASGRTGFETPTRRTERPGDHVPRKPHVGATRLTILSIIVGLNERIPCALIEEYGNPVAAHPDAMPLHGHGLVIGARHGDHRASQVIAAAP